MSLLFLLRQPLLELLYPSCRIHKFGAAGIEGVAFRANFNFNPFFGGADLKSVSAGATHGRFVIFRVDCLLHNLNLHRNVQFVKYKARFRARLFDLVNFRHVLYLKYEARDS